MKTTFWWKVPIDQTEFDWMSFQQFFLDGITSTNKQETEFEADKGDIQNMLGMVHRIPLLYSRPMLWSLVRVALQRKCPLPESQIKIASVGFRRFYLSCRVTKGMMIDLYLGFEFTETKTGHLDTFIIEFGRIVVFSQIIWTEVSS